MAILSKIIWFQPGCIIRKLVRWISYEALHFIAKWKNQATGQKIFRLSDIDENYASKLYNKTDMKGGSLALKNKKGISRKKSYIKTLIDDKRLICINRDRNACLNLRKLLIYFLNTCNGFQYSHDARFLDFSMLKKPERDEWMKSMHNKAYRTEFICLWH